MTYDSWKADEPMTDREPQRERDATDFDIATMALGDMVESVSTFEYAFGYSDTERSMIAEMLSGLLANLVEKAKYGQTAQLRQLNTAIREFATQGEKI